MIQMVKFTCDCITWTHKHVNNNYFDEINKQDTHIKEHVYFNIGHLFTQKESTFIFLIFQMDILIQFFFGFIAVVLENRQHYMSHLMRKLVFVCKIKDADQLYISKSEISSHSLWLYIPGGLRVRQPFFKP